MKAIIIAAGLGSRLQSHTESMPKCMLVIGGKPIIEYQFNALSSNNIHNIGIIKGYMREKIHYPGYREFINTDYFNNNILCSLMYAENFMDEDVIISYSDILYTADIISQLANSHGDISIVVDKAWRMKYVGRDSHPESEAEKTQYDQAGNALKLGKELDENGYAMGEFIGLLKLSSRGCEIFKKEFKVAKEKYCGKPFMNAPIFEKAYITDFLNYLIHLGYKVNCLLISDGWREIDTEQDYESAVKWIDQTPLAKAN